MTKRILCVGGCGFVGSHVVDDLVARGHVVFVLDDLSSCWLNEEGRPKFLNEEAFFVDPHDGRPVTSHCSPIDGIVHLSLRHPVERGMEIFSKAFEGYVVQAVRLLVNFAPTRTLTRFVVGATVDHSGPAESLVTSLAGALGYWHRPPTLGTYFVDLPELVGERRLPEAPFPDEAHVRAPVEIAAALLADLADGTRKHRKYPTLTLDDAFHRRDLEFVRD